MSRRGWESSPAMASARDQGMNQKGDRRQREEQLAFMAWQNTGFGS